MVLSIDDLFNRSTTVAHHSAQLFSAARQILDFARANGAEKLTFEGTIVNRELAASTTVQKFVLGPRSQGKLSATIGSTSSNCPWKGIRSHLPV